MNFVTRKVTALRYDLGEGQFCKWAAQAVVNKQPATQPSFCVLPHGGVSQLTAERRRIESLTESGEDENMNTMFMEK